WATHVDRPRTAFARAAAESLTKRSPAGERLPLLLGLLVHPPVRAELVVLAALVGIAEHFVRLVDLLELAFRALVAGVDVGMVLSGQLSESLLDVFFGRRLRYAERLVVILEFHQARDPILIK